MQKRPLTNPAWPYHTGFVLKSGLELGVGVPVARAAPAAIDR